MVDLHKTYMKQLHEWQKICNFHYAMSMRYFTTPFVPPVSPSQPIRNQHETSPPDQRQPTPSRTEFRPAPIPARIMAELIDFFILMTLKLFGMLIYTKLAGTSSDESVVAFHYQFLLTDISDEMDVTIDDLRYIMLMGLVYRLLACLYEATFLSVGGATPGKLMLGLEVVSCNTCVSLRRENREVLVVNPGGIPSLGKAWIRSIIKNFSITFLMPAFLTIFLYRHKRTSYDMVSSTIVVKIGPE